MLKKLKKQFVTATSASIPVEAELGALQGKEEDIVNEAEAHTDPAMVADFVNTTECDLLAVAVECMESGT